MQSSEEQKALLKRLNARATQTKMDLHDLSEELPTNWQRILEVAQAAYDAHAALAQARKDPGRAQEAGAPADKGLAP